jgi:hypothetical protein
MVASERQAKALSQSRSGMSIAEACSCAFILFSDGIHRHIGLPSKLAYLHSQFDADRKRKFAFTAAAPSQHPRETG